MRQHGKQHRDQQTPIAPRRRRRATTSAAVVLAMVLGGALGSCSTDADGGSADSSDVEAPLSAPGQADGSGGRTTSEGGSTGKRGGAGAAAGRAAVQTEAMIFTGEVVVVDHDLTTVRVEIDRLMGRYGGHVADESTDNDEDGETRRSTLVLRVPGRHFEEVLAAFRDFTTVQRTERAGEDVATELIDLDARIRTQEVSLRRLRSFLDRAEDVETMIRLESEIAQREASVESLRAQEKHLADQVALATVTVRMATPDAPPAVDDPLDDAGFLTGLRGGWGALQDVVVVLATVIGAVLPFALTLLAVGLPLLLWLRRRGTARPTPGPSAG